MAADSLIEAIALLKNPTGVEAQLSALKYLKNQAIGHKERKRELVRQGVVDALASTLALSTRSRGKRRFSETQSNYTSIDKTVTWTEEDEVRLQAILLVNSLANGGPAFAPAILAGNIVQALAGALSPNNNHSKVILATLRALVSLADSLQLTHVLAKGRRHQYEQFASTLSAKSTLYYLAQILAQKSSSLNTQKQVSFVCRLIKSLACDDENRKSLMASNGLLDLLAARLSACRVSQRGWSDLDPSTYAALPPPSSREDLKYLLEAVNAIVDSSKYRLSLLLHSPLLISVFPLVSVSILVDSAVQSSMPSVGLRPTMEDSLPRIYSVQPQSENGFSKAFPALGSLQPSVRLEFADSAQASIPEKGTNEVESEFIPWLIYLARTEDDSCRIQAANLLQLAVQLGQVSKSRERMLSMLIVPLLVAMLEEPKAKKTSSFMEPINRTLDYAPAVTAQVISQNVELQKSAVNAGVVKKLSTLIKHSFRTIIPPAAEWSVEGLQKDTEMMEVPASCRLDYDDLGSDLEDSFHMRESCLRLVAALASSKDEYRKQLTDSGIITYIIESLTPMDEDQLVKFVQNGSQEKLRSASFGNPIPVLIAACNAAKALSRSVSLLRTSLIDAGIAKPIFALLKHPKTDVLVAATDVICNLIIEFSPMRKDLEEAGAIKTLCEHAHSADSRIRLASLWALKHLVDKSPNEIKFACFEDLGTDWLIQIISGSSTEPSQISSNPSPYPPPNDDEIMLDTEEGGADLPLQSPDSTDPISTLLITPTSSTHNPYLASIKSAEEATTLRRAQSDATTIQAQGLDFLRNLIIGPGAPEMIDKLFAAVGAQRIFDLLLSKLPASSTDTPSPPPPPEIIHSTVFVIVHIAAGAPRHRALLIQQTSLLLALFPCLKHADPRIRVTSVWALNNLTWVDNQADAAGARQRVVELRRLGFEAALRDMREDGSLDVRERVGTSLDQMRVR